LLLLLCSTLSAGAVSSPFAPLPAGHWSYAAMSRLSTSGLLDMGIDFFKERDYLLSRYEMALWLSQALDVLYGGERDVGDVSSQIAKYNATHPAQALTPDDVQALRDLLSFLRPELRSMGYILGSPQLMAITLSPTDEQERQLLELGLANVGVLRLQPRGDNGSYPQIGLGLALDLGDVLFEVGQSASTHEGQHDSTTELGLNLRMQNVQIRLGYSAQGAIPILNPATAATGGKHTATAGLEYEVTPESRASADVRYSADAGGNTTTDFGLRFTQQGASVHLGYRLVDYSGPDNESSQDARDNIATAEFTIRF